MSYIRGSVPLPLQEDATSFLIDALRELGTSISGSGCDVWINAVAVAFARARGASVIGTSDYEQAAEDLSPPFFDAAWQLCRWGVLRPGRRTTHNPGPPADHYGYCVTDFGRKWIAENEKPAFIPTDPGRLTSLLTRRPDLFGQVYTLRANDAALCYSAHAYYACCAMIGAAAESILVEAGSAKLGEPQALNLYRGNSGRKALTGAVLKGCPEYVARDLRLHTDLINLWRDESAHAHSTSIGEVEAFTNLRGLIKFAHFAEERWQHLTASSS